MHEGEWGSIHEGNSRNLYNRGVSETRTQSYVHTTKQCLFRTTVLQEL